MAVSSAVHHRGTRVTEQTISSAVVPFDIVLCCSAVWCGWEVGSAGRADGARPAWEVHVDSGRVTVGDTVGLTFRLRLDERDLLFDSLPRPVDSAFDGVRIVSVERLHRLANRDFVGRAVLPSTAPGRSRSRCSRCPSCGPSRESRAA